MRRLILFLALAGSAFAQTIPADVGVFNLAGGGGGGGGSGTVTSVSFTGGLITVTNPTTTPAFTVAGTSGGIPYFSSASTWASSGLLAANSLVIGGGAGTAPSTTTTGSGILTWLGTPSSANLRGAMTDETGTGILVFATDPTFTLTDVTTNNSTTVQHGWLPKLGGGTTNFLRADGTWAAPGGSGTVTVVAAGSLTSTALVTGGGTQTLQTPSATATMDSSGNISTPGTLTVGNAATTAGAVVLTQGTTQSTGTTNATFQAPTSVTSYVGNVPASVGTNNAFWTQTTSGTTLTLANSKVVPTGTVIGDTDTQTLTNKRVTTRALTVASSATPTANTDNADVIYITALAATITSMTTNLTGTPVAFDQLEYWIVDNGTARGITWGASFAAGPVALPTTTVLSKPLHVFFERNPGSTAWVCMATSSDL